MVSNNRGEWRWDEQFGIGFMISPRGEAKVYMKGGTAALEICVNGVERMFFSDKIKPTPPDLFEWADIVLAESRIWQFSLTA